MVVKVKYISVRFKDFEFWPREVTGQVLIEKTCFISYHKGQIYTCRVGLKQRLLTRIVPDRLKLNIQPVKSSALPNPGHFGSLIWQIGRYKKNISKKITLL